jgi:methyl-accepting chemotaxis protein
MGAGEEAIQTDKAMETASSLVAAEWVESCRKLCAQLAETGEQLDRVCRTADPSFVRTGRDLQVIARETRTLTESIRHTAGLFSGGEGEQSPLDRSGRLIQNILDRLACDRQEIERELCQIRDLMAQIADSRRINDAIDTISASFRAVRINIRIQCGAQLGNDDIFKDVTEDIDSLSRSLARITKQIKVDLSATAKNLTSLERTVSANLLASERVAANARAVVTKAYGDISQLFLSTQNMMQEAGRRAEVITGKVDAIIVGIQFHDSLSQRTNHILKAFADVAKLCAPGEQGIDPDALGSSFLILELQHRQLAHIIDEVSAIHLRIKQSFSAIGAEVKGLNSLLVDNKSNSVGSELLLAGLYASLQKALLQLCDLVAEGEGMIDQFKSAAAETRNVAGRLVEIMRDVRAMREETRLQAVNTIIMASNLGQRGRTIQVLAKEISALSEQTSELVTNVEFLQNSVNQRVESLCQSWEKFSNGTGRNELQAEVNSIDESYREVRDGCRALTGQIESSWRHIEDVYHSLDFIQKLQEGLWAVAARIEQARDTLLPWRDRASSDRTEINQLIQRYTMEQERLIHMFDRVEGEEVRQDEGDIFF